MTVIRDIIEKQAHTAKILSLEKAQSEVRAYRYERKFLVENSRVQTIEGIVHLHPTLFYSIYAPRFINNIYLDTDLFLNYRNAVDGIANRFKARIRWYGDILSTSGSPRLEIKGKEGFVNYKSVYPLHNVEFCRKIDATAISRLLDSSDLPSEINNYLSYTRPVLINRYRRKYWRSRDERYRLTLDHKICFSAFTPIEIQEIRRIVDDTNVIVEIKYDLADDDSFADIANKFPFRQTRSSKYVAGMDYIYQLGNYC
jgi:hypothetical protein